MSTIHKLLDDLSRTTPTLSPKLRIAAKIILDKPNAVATSSMRGLAKQAGVTPPTMIRLAKALGFENYEQLKNIFLESFNGQNFEQRANWLQQAAKAGGEATIAHDLAKASHNNIQEFYQGINLDSVCRAADLIINSPSVYIIAAGGLRPMAAYMQYVGRMAVPHMRIPRCNGNALVEGLLAIRENDVVIALAYNPYSKQTIEALELALTRGAKFIYFTDSKAAPLSSSAEVLLLQTTDSPQFFPSMVSVVSAIETLIAVIVARSGHEAIDTIADYAEIRKHSYISI